MTISKLFFLTLILSLIHNSLSAQNKAILSITIKNISNLTYEYKIIEVPWENLENHTKIDTSELIVLDSNGDQMAFQLEKFGNKGILNLLIQLDLKPQQSKSIKLAYGKRINFITKTYGRYVPERKDDFAWENDNIAFRMYGKALEATPKENAYGIDVWVKRTDRLIINERYKLGEYHIDHGDGMDYYHVGLTLGAGNMMPVDKDSIYYSKNYIDFKILDNGPLRTTFQLFYDSWLVKGKSIKAVKTITLDAGSWLNKIKVEYDTDSNNFIPVVAGIITREGRGIKILNEENGLIQYWEPSNSNYGTTGVACIIPSPILKMTEKNNQLLAYTQTDGKGRITYYSGATWDKQGTFQNHESWMSYLSLFKSHLENQLIININE